MFLAPVCPGLFLALQSLRCQVFCRRHTSGYWLKTGFMPLSLDY